jgi:hypothetical protein
MGRQRSGNRGSRSGVKRPLADMTTARDRWSPAARKTCRGYLTACGHMPYRLELSLINWVATNQPVSASGVHADVEDSCVHSSITVQVRSASRTGATRSRDPLKFF